ncbi:MAG: ATP-dependent RNA helicase [Euryarchaeota archaeon]|nr:ATP-dependent RNA helicase [Euryarchaeota archaeon]
MQNNTFESFGISKEILDSINKKGWKNPTDIQKDSIPFALSGQDILGQAKTGSGKTVSFGIPAIEKCIENKKLQVLILTPTRELASQVYEEISWLKGERNLNIAAFYGGVGIEPQIEKLESGLELLVGTPGRIIDLIRRGNIDTSSIELFILDEADRMLDMGFFPDVEWIIQKLNPERQTLLFSATFPQEILHLSSEFMKNPEHILTSELELEIPDITQKFSKIGRINKSWALNNILLEFKFEGQVLVFCNTKRMVEMLEQRFSKVLDKKISSLQGDMSQNAREKVMTKFKSGEIDLLISTDVAARGLHVDGVNLVVNYDLPTQVDSYVHRIGRTGRMGNSGLAWSLVSFEETSMITMLKNVHGLDLIESEIPEIKGEEKSHFSKKKDWNEHSDMFGMVSLGINIGYDEGMSHQKLFDWVKSLIRISDLALGSIDVGDDKSTIDVHQSKVDYVLGAINNNSDLGRIVDVEIL